MDLQQQEALCLAVGGHSLAIIGTAGTGKSFLIKHLVEGLNRVEKKVLVTAATGIAAVNLKALRATTVHSALGIFDGRFSDREIQLRMEKDEAWESKRKAIADSDVLIIDEASMISSKIFHQCEFICRIVKRGDRAFGGMQVILVMDPRQLPPVPDHDYGDNGQYCFESALFPHVVPHVVRLTTVYRQSDPKLESLIEEVFSGCVSKESDNLLEWLERPLVHTEPTILCADNLSTDLRNRRALQLLPGPFLTYKARDKGEAKHLAKTRAPAILLLKVGCPVMLITNYSQEKGLVNGTTGVLLAAGDDTVRVKFGSQMATLQRWNFSRHDTGTGQVLATRLQFPLKVAYCLTIYKAQGLEFPSVEVDAKNIWKPGMLGVAISRVSNMDQLRVINYRPGLCPPPPAAVRYFLATESQPPSPDLSCCHKAPLDNLSNDDEDNDGDNDDNDDDDNDGDDDDDHGEVYDVEVLTVDPQELPDPVDTPESLPGPEHLLETIRCQSLITSQQQAINLVVDQLQCDQDRVAQFCSYIYGHLHKCFPHEETMKTAQQVAFSKAFYAFLTKDVYQLLCKQLFNLSVLKPEHLQVAKRLASQIKEFMFTELAAAKAPSTKEVPSGPAKKIASLDEHDISASKVRYIGGSVVARLRHLTCQLIRRHITDSSTTVIDQAEKDEEIYRQLAGSDEETAYPGSLRYIDYKRRGHLTQLSDPAYTFFIGLEKKRLQLHTFPNLVCRGRSMPGSIEQELWECPELRTAFLQSLAAPTIQRPPPGTGRYTEVRNLLESTLNHAMSASDTRLKMIHLYMKSTHKRFRMEVKQELQMKKGEAHRKKIMKRKSDAEKKQTQKLKKPVHEPAQMVLQPEPDQAESQPESTQMEPAQDTDMADQGPENMHTEPDQTSVTTEEPQAGQAGTELDQTSSGAGSVPGTDDSNFCAAPGCGKPYKEGRRWVGCDGCTRWFEVKCTDIGSNWRKWVAIKDQKKQWFCQWCKHKAE